MSAISAGRKWAFNSCLRSKRLIPIMLVALLPAIISAIGAWAGAWDSDSGGAFRDLGRFIAPLCLYFVLPMMCMFTMLPNIGELYEGGAIGYFWTRPCPRWQPIIGVHQGSVLALILLCGIAIGVNMFIMMFTESISFNAELSNEASTVPFSDWLARSAGLWAVMSFGGIAYGAICIFLAGWSKRAALWSIGMLIGWGAIVGALPGSLRNTSPHRYLFGLLREWCEIENTWSGMFIPDSDPPSTLLSLATLMGITVVFLGFSYIAAQNRDVN